MSRVLEAIFRHPMQLLLMLIFPAVVGLGIAYVLPRSYQSSASLWALQRYAIIGATGPETNLQATPAETQVTALTELLQSSAFSLAVARSTDLQSMLSLGSGSTQVVNDALSQEIAKHVLVASHGNNLYEITYVSKNAHVAYQVVSAVIKQFQLQSQDFSVVEAENLLQGYSTQLTRAQKQADTDASAEAQYLAAHPNLTQQGANPTNDPQYALLDAKRLQSQATLQNIQSTIATINQQIATQSTGNTIFKTLDNPLQPDVALSRSKTLEVAGGAGAAVGLLVCILYVLMLVRRDRTLYTPLDLQKITGYPILMQIPQLSATTIRAVIAEDEV